MFTVAFTLHGCSSTNHEVYAISEYSFAPPEVTLSSAENLIHVEKCFAIIIVRTLIAQRQLEVPEAAGGSLANSTGYDAIDTR